MLYWLTTWFIAPHLRQYMCMPTLKFLYAVHWANDSSFSSDCWYAIMDLYPQKFINIFVETSVGNWVIAFFRKLIFPLSYLFLFLFLFLVSFFTVTFSWYGILIIWIIICYFQGSIFFTIQDPREDFAKLNLMIFHLLGVVLLVSFFEFIWISSFNINNVFWLPKQEFAPFYHIFLYSYLCNYLAVNYPSAKVDVFCSIAKVTFVLNSVVVIFLYFWFIARYCYLPWDFDDNLVFCCVLFAYLTWQIPTAIRIAFFCWMEEKVFDIPLIPNASTPVSRFRRILQWNVWSVSRCTLVYWFFHIWVPIYLHIFVGVHLFFLFCPNVFILYLGFFILVPSTVVTLIFGFFIKLQICYLNCLVLHRLNRAKL